MWVTLNVLLWKLVNFSCKGRVLLGDLILFEKRHHVRADPQSKDPLPEYGSPFDHKTKRTKETKIQFWQFPLNISNARTVHKLQGRSIDNLVVSSFDYTDNWIYVVLSRVRTIKGLFLTSELNNIKTRGMSALCLQFHNALESTNHHKICSIIHK